MVHKHIPQRTCVVCRTTDAKRQLLRLVRTTEGVFVDPSGKAHGRGAYVCDDNDCRHKVAQGQVLNKALRTSLTDADRERLRQIVI